MNLDVRLLKARVGCGIHCYLRLSNEDPEISLEVSSIEFQFSNYLLSPPPPSPGRGDPEGPKISALGSFLGYLNLRATRNKDPRTQGMVASGPRRAVTGGVLIPPRGHFWIQVEEDLPGTWLPTFTGRLMSSNTRLQVDVAWTTTPMMMMQGTAPRSSRKSVTVQWFSIKVSPKSVPESLFGHFPAFRDLLDHSPADSSQSDPTVIANPFQRSGDSWEDQIPWSLPAKLSSMVPSMSALSAKIRNSSGHEVANLWIAKRVLTTEEAVTAMLDFHVAPRDAWKRDQGGEDGKNLEQDTKGICEECVQFSASLVAVETVESDPAKSNPKLAKPKTSFTTVATYTDFVLGVSSVGFRLAIPKEEAYPTFETNGKGSLAWLVRLEFVLVPSRDISRQSHGDLGLWRAPKKLEVKTLKWNVPLVVYKP